MRESRQRDTILFIFVVIVMLSGCFVFNCQIVSVTEQDGRGCEDPCHPLRGVVNTFSVIHALGILLETGSPPLCLRWGDGTL